MKVKVNENIILDVRRRSENEVLKTGKVRCCQVKCFGNYSIECSQCLVYGEGEFEVEYSKVKVD